MSNLHKVQGKYSLKYNFILFLLSRTLRHHHPEVEVKDYNHLEKSEACCSLDDCLRMPGDYSLTPEIIRRAKLFNTWF